MKLVSLFVDIDRVSFSTHSRSPLRYFHDFANGIALIDCELIIFGDKESLHYLEEFLGQNKPVAKITLLPLEFEALPFAALQDRVEEVLRGAAMRFYSTRDSLLAAKNLPRYLMHEFLRRIKGSQGDIWSHLPVRSPKAPEYLNAKYLQVTWAKIWVTLRVFELGLADRDEPIVFADFGLGHSTRKFTNNVRNRTLTPAQMVPKKVSLTQRGSLGGVESVWSLAQRIDDALIPAGVFGGDFEALEKMQQYVESSIYDHLEMGLAPDDQVLFALYAAQNPNEVALLPGQGAFNGWYRIDHFLSTKY